jgi:hypothetical protein
MAGQLREIFLADLIAPLLPEGFRAATGKIVDRHGNLSSQTDLIIYNKARFTPLMFNEQTGVFPIDSVFYSIEVKSTSSATAVRDSIEKGRSLRALEGPHVHHALFSFKTDLATPEAEIQRFQTAQVDTIPPLVNICCTAGAGYTRWTDQGWGTHMSTERHAEVIGFIIGIVNTLVTTANRPVAANPGDYLAWW